MLAYLFWHEPEEGVPLERYEQALESFHRSLAARPPVGLLESRCYRTPPLPWLGANRPAYEDWYLLEDYAALGVLNEAAVGRGHVSAHEQAAHMSARGAAGLYRLCEGTMGATISTASWIGVTRRTAQESVQALLLGDGSERAQMALWRRELVLGPAPEYCLLSDEAPSGIASGRLPDGWSTETQQRESFRYTR